MMKASLRDGLGMAAARDAGRANSGSRIIGRVGGYGFAVNGGPANNRFNAEQMAALIAWMLVVRIDDLVKDGAISAVTRVFDALWRRRLRRSSILDKIINANTVLSKRSRPLSRPPVYLTTTAHTSSTDRAAHDRRDLGGEQLDHPGDFCKRQAADVDLRQEALVAEQLALIEDLVDDLLRAADENRAMRGGAFLIIGARDLLGAILRRRVGEEVAGIVRIKAVQGVLRVLFDVHVGGDADFERVRGVSGLQSAAPVELGERRELCRRHADIGERQRQTERAGAGDAIRRAAGADPDRQPVLRRPRRNWRVL